MKNTSIWGNLIAWANEKVANQGSRASLDLLCDFVTGGIARSPVLAPTSLENPIPYGRFLIHSDPAERYNIQLDVFSKNYAGLAHAHETWGAFWVLRGRLRVLNWAADAGNNPTWVASQSILHQGSGGCFSPPFSDWHEVRVDEPSDQVLSVHVYGQGFDLDRGIYKDKEGRIQSGPRGPLRPWQDLSDHIHVL